MLPLPAAAVTLGLYLCYEALSLSGDLDATSIDNRRVCCRHCGTHNRHSAARTFTGCQRTRPPRAEFVRARGSATCIPNHEPWRPNPLRPGRARVDHAI